MAEEQPATAQPDRLSNGVDRMVYWLTRHWLAVFNTAIAIYVGLPLLAPVLMNAGATRPARLIYLVYSPMCHQMASRSFFLFGDQYAYPRDIAGTNLAPIEAYMPEIPEFAGISPAVEDWVTFLLPARRFVGNEQMGYKTALCERDMAIYGFVLIGGLVYGLVRKRRNVKPLPVWAFILFGLGPIALDGFSQLFSQYGVALQPLSFFNTIFPLRESSPFLRTLTGAMFGFSLVWLTYPHIGASMKGTERSLQEKMEQERALE
ncbi:MAG: DUF2085 domain-containing protein [Chloroflexi bacterium]|jgi:uncharacterized membrane protein|nr:DUF2085 domain-containing protein [Chloroflexota bacterium]